jgi:hypothetical protein
MEVSDIFQSGFAIDNDCRLVYLFEQATALKDFQFLKMRTNFPLQCCEKMLFYKIKNGEKNTHEYNERSKALPAVYQAAQSCRAVELDGDDYPGLGSNNAKGS